MLADPWCFMSTGSEEWQYLQGRGKHLLTWAPSIRPGMSATVSEPPSEYATVPSCGRRVVNG